MDLGLSVEHIQGPFSHQVQRMASLEPGWGLQREESHWKLYPNTRKQNMVLVYVLPGLNPGLLPIKHS